MSKVIVTISTQQAEERGWRSSVFVGRQPLSTSWHATKSAALTRSRSLARIWGGVLPKGETVLFLKADAAMTVTPAENNGWRANIIVGDKTPKTVWVMSKQGAIKWANNIAQRAGIPKSSIKVSAVSHQQRVGARGPHQRDFDRA